MEPKKDPKEYLDDGQLDFSDLFKGPGTLFTMLGVFVLIGIVTLLTAVGSPEATHQSEAAVVAYGPEDFPKVFDFDPLEGLYDEDGNPVGTLAVPPPPFDQPDYFPCSDCHEGDPGDPERRELDLDHEHIVLEHDTENRWCLDCHLDTDRDYLHLADGSPVPFTESYRLCGQCHGTQYRDWRFGAHGRRRGYWDEGPKSYLLCVHCHDPHAPAFEGIRPLPPPISPHAYAEPHSVPEDLPSEWVYEDEEGDSDE